jgi:hypothetical protein
MKIIVCIRHLKCICRKWRRGIDYSWHVQHLLREFGRGQFADPRFNPLPVGFDYGLEDYTGPSGGKSQFRQARPTLFRND